MDQLDHQGGTNQEGSTSSYSHTRRRNTAPKTLTVGSRDQSKRGDTAKNRPHIQNIRSRATNGQGLHQQKLGKKVYLTILLKV